MVNVTGTLSDFGLDALAPFQPLLIFTASGPAVTTGRVLATRPVKVVPATDGGFSVDLSPTVNLRPETWYTITIRWLDADGGFIGQDDLQWVLRVPPEGGDAGDLIEAPGAPTQAWVGPTPPANPAVYVWWIDTSQTPPVLYEWS